MAIALNKFNAILLDLSASDSILRLRLKAVNADSSLYVLLLDNKKNLESYLNKQITLGFKESAVLVAKNIQNAQNTLKAQILEINTDGFFARLKLVCDFGEFSTLINAAFIDEFKKGDFVDCAILESEISLFL